MCAFVLILVLVSCSSSERLPEGVLNKDEMAKVLTEFALKEAKINTFHVGTDSAARLFKVFRESYQEKSGVPDSIIDKSFEYYLARPADFAAIYDRVIDTLALRESKMVSRGRPQP